MVFAATQMCLVTINQHVWLSGDLVHSKQLQLRSLIMSVHGTAFNNAFCQAFVKL